jgi:hypothetical protein
MKSTARTRRLPRLQAPPLLFLVALVLAPALTARAQDSRPGPLTPPPGEEHNVRRLSTNPVPGAPPALPPEEIIKRFAQKEDEYIEASGHFLFHKTIRLQEIGEDGKPAGQAEITVEPAVTPEGKLYYRIVGQPRFTLKDLRISPEDLETLARVQAYPLTTGQLAKYDLKYVGKEQVDEISCYLFQVRPKIVERARAYFDGIVWVDEKFLEVVKTYGKWVTDLGDVHSPTLPFTLFETYRENVEGKYWLPNYSRSDDVLHLKAGDIPIRLIVKWTDFRRISPPKSATPAPPPAKPGR